jgi:osmotically-inducible protein OsmY
MRSDRQLRDDLLAELNCEPCLDARYIGVSIAGGIAALTGHVAGFAEKLAAGATARRVGDIKALVDKIDVMLPASTERPDMDIASDIAAQRRGQVELPCERLMVQVEQGRVKLLGDVDWLAVKSNCEPSN